MKEVMTLTRVYRFSAGHRLYNPKFTDEENWRVFGKCTNKNGHGHDYYLEVTVTGNVDPESGMLVNVRDLDDAVGELLEELDHKRLDVEHPFFRENFASGELIVKYCWMRLEPALRSLGGARLNHLKLWETPNNSFEYFVEER
ncbi:MAG: 6-carboxytetrahydropterin synthase [Candidatus Caldarchaeum sp.]